MRKFIKRVTNAYQYEHEFDKEPLFFKSFIALLVVLYYIFIFIYAIVAFVTSPLWVIPYAIWWTRKNR